jgi:hypothetical protein
MSKKKKELQLLATIHVGNMGIIDGDDLKLLKKADRIEVERHAHYDSGENISIKVLRLRKVKKVKRKTKKGQSPLSN